jgi:hypothetical protein
MVSKGGKNEDEVRIIILCKVSFFELSKAVSKQVGISFSLKSFVLKFFVQNVLKVLSTFSEDCFALYFLSLLSFSLWFFSSHYVDFLLGRFNLDFFLPREFFEELFNL